MICAMVWIRARTPFAGVRIHGQTAEGEQMRKLTVAAAILVLAGTFVSVGARTTYAEGELCHVQGDVRDTDGDRTWGNVQHDRRGIAEGTWHGESAGQRFVGQPEVLSCQVSEDSIEIRYTGQGRVGSTPAEFFVEVNGRQRDSSSTGASFAGNLGFGYGELGGVALYEDEFDVVIETRTHPGQAVLYAALHTND
jgi:hypothetical protein